MSNALVIFGWCAVVTSLVIIVVPFMRGRGDLITSWTIFHFGAANFLGIASIQTGNTALHIYVQPREEDFGKFVWGGVIFYLSIILTYYLFPLGRMVGNHVFLKVAPRAPRIMVIFLPICVLFTMGYLFVPQVQFIGQWMVTIGRASCMFAVVFSLCAWSQRPFNTALGVLAGMTLIFASIAVNTELGRRDFLSVLITVPLCWYWFRGRYYKPTRVMAIAGVFTAIAFIGIAGVGLTRFAYRSRDLSIMEAAWEKLKAIPDAFRAQGTGTEPLFGSDCVEASLASIRLYDRVKQTQPFFVLKYILVHPIPRAWWPKKPEGLGYTLPIDIGWVGQHGAVSIGPGIVGHGYQEGGLFYIAFYGLLFGTVFRFFDTMLIRDPGNPYLLGILGAASGHIIGLLRGDTGLFSALVMGIFVAGVVVNYIGRLLFWTDRWQQGIMVAPDSAATEYQSYDAPAAMPPEWQTY